MKKQTLHSLCLGEYQYKSVLPMSVPKLTLVSKTEQLL